MRINDKEEYIIDAYIHTDKDGSVVDKSQNPDFQNLVPKDTAINISNVLLELDIYESLDKSYLTGRIVIGDFDGIKEQLNIQGIEKLTLYITPPNGDEIPIYKSFIVTEIISTSKLNDYFETLSLRIVEDHAYFGMIKKISQTFEGTPIEIMKQLYDKHLYKQMDIISKDANSIHTLIGKMRYISPNISSFAISDSILQKISTTFNGPFFAYSTLTKDNIQLGELKELLDQDPQNPQIKYVYSGLSDADDELENALKIYSFKTSNYANTFEMAMHGLLNSKLSTFDTTTGFIDHYKHNINETINSYLDNENEMDNSSDFIFDGVIKNPYDISEGLIDVEAQNFSIVTSSRPYATTAVGSNTEVSGFHDETFNPSGQDAKLRSNIIKSLLLNNTYTITIDGRDSIIKDNPIKCGALINVEHTNIVVNNGNSDAPQIDPDRSGQFLIYRIKHEFKQQRHRIKLDIVKLTRGKR